MESGVEKLLKELSLQCSSLLALNNMSWRGGMKSERKMGR